MDHAYWGPLYSEEKSPRDCFDMTWRRALFCRRTESRGVVASSAAIIADGKILGWFQGRAEWARAPLAIEALSPTRAVRK